jgi:hypothetical protein
LVQMTSSKIRINQWRLHRISFAWYFSSMTFRRAPALDTPSVFPALYQGTTSVVP